MSRWFKSVVKPAPTMVAAEEEQHLQQVEHALLQLLNDDVAEADRILKQQASSYHHLGRGLSSFIGAMLAAEKELLKVAATKLQASETKAWDDMKKAEKEPAAFKSSIYPPGTEYLLCYSISQLTSAICAVLSGSVTEAIKGFYKLRKAFITLDGIMDLESAYIKKMVSARRKSMGRSNSDGPAPAPTSRNHALLDEKLVEPGTTPEGSLRDIPSSMDHDDEALLSPVTRAESRLLDIDPAAIGITHHTDIFIHSGTRLCYGILLVVFSMIESPLFTRILHIIGFKGDRERGTRYLWQAARFNNFNSALAGITLLSYYNGLVGFSDILPTDAHADEDLGGNPRARCKALLFDMRRQHPESKFWKMEESRMYGYDRNLSASLKILRENADSKMKQLAAINLFEMSLVSMFVHDYEASARNWIQCAELSTWSPTLYAYNCGSNYLELYRNLRDSDPAAAKGYKEKATEYFRKAPPLAGRQKVMAKPLPVDVYIVRKLQKWEERAKAWKVDLADAVGVSPLVEMIYFWGGGKKQNEKEVEQTLGLLGWDRTMDSERFENDLDETAVRDTLTACFMRNTGKISEAKEILETKVINRDRSEFKGRLKDDWSLPAAYYEMACLAWQEKDISGADHNAKVAECAEILEKLQRWGEPYLMDTRVGLKVATSVLLVKRHKKIMGIA